MQERSYRWMLFTLGLFVFTADQATKYGVFNRLYTPERLVGSYEIIPGAFNLHVQFEPEHQMPGEGMFTRWNGPIPPRVNHGALFSLGGGYKANANLFFGIISVLAALGITFWGLRKASGQDRWLCLALGLILGGTLGNMFDRFIFGGVRDFLNFYLINWPIFNVADCGLVVGAAILFIQAIFGQNTPPSVTTSPTPEAKPAS